MKNIKPEVVGIGLLSREDALNKPQWLLACDGPWWLTSDVMLDNNNIPTENRQAIVTYYGIIDGYGTIASCDSVGVRPVLKVKNLADFELDQYGIIKIYNRYWQKIDYYHVLCCECIANHYFSRTGKNYEESEIKESLENWLEGQKNAYEVSDGE